MKPENALTSEEDDSSVPYSPLTRLDEFCVSYSAMEASEMFCRLVTALIGGNYRALSNLSRERLLNYIEALETLLPALHDIYSKTAALKKLEQTDTYENYVAFRRLFISLKRHPE